MGWTCRLYVEDKKWIQVIDVESPGQQEESDLGLEL
jgi:hypothetical protein